MLITIVQIVARPGTRNVLAFLRTQTLEQRRARSGADTILCADRHEPGDGLPVAGDDERLPRADPSQQLRELAVGVGGRDGGGHGGFLYVVLLTTLHYLAGLGVPVATAAAGCIPTFLYMGAASGDDRYFTRARAAAAFFACDETNATSDVGVEMDAGSGPTASTPGSVRISLTNVSPISTSPFASASIAAAPPRAR